MAALDRARPRTECCLYCSRPWTRGVVSKSDEHPLGQWRKNIETDLPAGQTVYEARVDFDEAFNELVGVPVRVASKDASILSLKTREVCGDCNGDLGKLQDKAKPIILQLERVAEARISLALSGADSRTLAMWAQSAALTYELTSEGPRVGTVSMGQQLREGKPLRNSVVFLAHLPQDHGFEMMLAQIDVSATRIPRPGPPDRRILMVAIASHRLAILVFISDSPGPVGPLLSAWQWVLLWPSSDFLEYPPRGYVGLYELRRLLAEPGRWMAPVQVPIRAGSASVPQGCDGS